MVLSGFAEKLSDLVLSPLEHPSLAKPLYVLVFPDKYQATAEVKLDSGQICKVQITEDAKIWSK